MSPTTAPTTPDPIDEAEQAVYEADLAEEAAQERAEGLRAEVEQLREAVRDGQRTTRKEIADAEGEADHAELEAVAAQRAAQAARDRRRALRIEAAKERLRDTATIAAVVMAEGEIAAAVDRVCDLVERYNSAQAAAVADLQHLGADGWTSSTTRAPRYDMSGVIAKAVLRGIGGDGDGVNRLVRQSTYRGFATELRNAAVNT